MKVQLLYPDRSFLWDQPAEPLQEDLLQDLELPHLLTVMAGGDPACYARCQQVLLTSLDTEAEIQYRQAILRDFLRLPDLTEQLEALLQTLHRREQEIHRVGILMEYPTSMVHYGADRLEIQLEILEQLRSLCRQSRAQLQAPGLLAFADRLEAVLTDAFLQEASAQLRVCRFQRGITTAITLGPGLKPRGFCPAPPEAGGLSRLRSRLKEKRYVFSIAEQDSNGMKALSQLQQKCFNAVGNVLMQSTTHVAGFFEELEQELSFYRGCLRLHEALQQAGCPMCWPETGPWTYGDLRDCALTLRKQAPAVGNSHDLADSRCIIITGANQGGKTTYLRSVGQAAVLHQAGMFVGAASLTCPVYPGIFTHFRREEDRDLHSGKLEEELQRMDQIVTKIRSGACLLMNESFAATNEEDGSEIGFQVMEALLDRGVQIFCVTHFYELSRRFLPEDRVQFLRALRQPDGSRTYRLTPGAPEPTGHGQDLYRRVFSE